MAYGIIKTKKRRRRPMMQRLFMGLIVTVGAFFGYDYVFDQDPNIIFETDEITAYSIDYTLSMSQSLDDVTAYLLIVDGPDSSYRIEYSDTPYSGSLSDLDANTTYVFTLYTVTETSQTKVFEKEVLTKELVYDE